MRGGAWAKLEQVLPAEVTLRVLALAAECEIRRDDPEMVTAAMVAEMVLEVKASIARLEGLRDEFFAQLVEAKGELEVLASETLPLSIKEAHAVALDDSQGEVRAFMRDVAQDELRAASVARTGAVREEVQALKRAVVDAYAGGAQANASGVVRAGPSAAPAAGSSIWGGLGAAQVAVLALVVFLVGLLGGKVLEDRGYRGWVPSAVALHLSDQLERCAHGR